jgi:predicted nucleic acid-binding Zn ribbon protein
VSEACVNEREQRRRAIVTAVVLGAMVLAIYLTVVLKLAR